MAALAPPVAGADVAIVRTLARSQSQTSTDEDPLKSSDSIEKSSPTNYDSVFDDPLLAKHFTPPDSYESKHRFDPNAVWSEAEERAVVSKCDVRIIFFVCVCFAALQLDRINIASATSDNFLKDCGMSTNDFNHGMTVFYCCFLLAELPSQLIGKRLGVERWVPLQMCAWSIVAILQCKVSGKAGYIATRALLGLLEGGFIPNAVLLLSYFYTAAELATRLSFFWITMSTTTIIQALLATGILKLRGMHGWPGWRYLFLIEGLMTLTIGILAFLLLPTSPTQTKGGLRGKNGWFNEREETIIVTRVLRDDPSKSQMHNRQGLSFEDLMASVCEFDLYPLYILGMTSFIGPGTVSTYLTLTIRSLGFTTFQTNLMTIPCTFFNIVNNYSLAWLSRRVGERTWIASIGSIWQFAFLLVIVLIPDGTNKWAKYAILSLYLSFPYAHPILVSWTSANSGSVRTRSVSASAYNGAVQLGSIIGTQIYHTKDAPYYHKGNHILLYITCANLVLFAATKAYYVQRNKSKRRRWDALTVEEKDQYLATTSDRGNKRLDFQFVH